MGNTAVFGMAGALSIAVYRRSLGGLSKSRVRSSRVK